MKEVQIKSGHKVGMGFVPTNTLMHCLVEETFTAQEARATIEKIFDLCHLSLNWQFLYDASSDQYLLSLEGVAKWNYDSGGRRLSIGPAAPQNK